MPGLNLGHSLDELVEIVESPSFSGKIRLFAGYAGWSPGQLDEEMKRQAWLVHSRNTGNDIPHAARGVMGKAFCVKKVGNLIFCRKHLKIFPGISPLVH